MDMRAELRQRAEQRLALLPQMLQSIEILQLATTDLVGLIDAELQRNEVLDSVPSELAAGELAAEVGPDPAAAREETFDADRFVGTGSVEASDRHLALLHNAPADPTPDLIGELRQQLAWRDVPDSVADHVLVLAGHLDDRGLLPLDDAELARLLPEQALGEALSLLQTLEPLGLGARSGVEAMLLQVAADDPDRDLLARLLTDHLDELARNKLPLVAKALDCSLDELELLLGRLRELRPAPAGDYGGVAAQPIRPDLVAFLLDGEPCVALADSGLPGLELNPEYSAMAASRETPTDVRRYLREKVAAAQELIRAVAHRHSTLLRVGEALMRRQVGFLADGPAAIRPLKMAELAQDLDLHASTVSRAVADKHVLTDRGTFPLRAFFDGARGDAAASGTGRLGVRERIAALVAAEDRTHPLSDEDLVAALAADGLRVARRTVAKHRSELGIPSSFRRRDHLEPDRDAGR